MNLKTARLYCSSIYNSSIYCSSNYCQAGALVRGYVLKVDVPLLYKIIVKVK